jgi:hypothetical protein
MSDPLTDMSLLSVLTNPRQVGVLDLYPFRRMDLSTAPAVWSDWTPATRTRREYWTLSRPVTIHLPGVALVQYIGPGWATRHGEIRAQPGYGWDGASGPAIDDPAAVLASLVHDIVCTRIPDGGHPLPSYCARHWLYARIIRAQGEPVWRWGMDWVGLMVANWYVDLRQ